MKWKIVLLISFIVVSILSIGFFMASKYSFDAIPFLQRQTSMIQQSQYPDFNSLQLIQKEKWFVTEPSKDWDIDFSEPYKQDSEICFYDVNAKSINDIDLQKTIYFDDNPLSLNSQDVTRTSKLSDSKTKYGYCITPTKKDYLKLNPVAEYQNESRIEYETDWGTKANVTLFEYQDGSYNLNVEEVWIEANSTKFGVNHSSMNLTEVRQFQYQVQSTSRIMPNGNKPYIYKNSYSGFPRQQNQERHYFNFEDICSRNFTDNSTSDCKFNYYQENGLYYLNVTFNSDWFIDPTVIISEFITIDSFNINSTVEGNFSHLEISDVFPYDRLILYMPFDVENKSDGIMYDWGKHNNDMVITNATWLNDGAYGGFMNFTKQGSELKAITESSTYTGMANFTAMAWIKFEGNPTTNVEGNIFDAWEGGDTNYLIRYAPDDNEWEFYTDTSSGVVAVKIEQDVDMEDGEWHHVAFIYNGTHQYGFQDGVQSAELSAQTGSIESGTLDLIIGGQQSSSTDFWKGGIDEAMIFNISLTAQQISDIYNNQSSRFKDIGTQELKQFNSTGYFNRVNASIDNFQRLFESNISLRFGSWNITNGYNDTEDGVGFTVDDGLIGYWHFDSSAEFGESSSLAYDFSGQLNNGTIVGNPNINDSKFVYDKAIHLDGVGDYVNMGNLSDTEIAVWNDSFTLSYWFYAKQNTALEFMTTQLASGTAPGMSIYLQNGGIDAISITNGTDNCDSFDILFDAGEWHHFTLMRNETNLTVFLNGNIERVIDCRITNVTVSDDFMLGEYAGLTFNGSIDEVMIHNRSLIASEIKEIYVKGKANYQYTPYQNLTAINTNHTFNITNGTNYLPSFLFLAGNQTVPFYSSILEAGMTFDFYSEAEGEPPLVDDSPVVNLLSPSNATSSDTVSEYSFNASIIDDINITNATLYIWFENGSLYNTTNWTDIVEETEYWANSTVNLTIYENYTWNYLAYDNASTSNSAWNDTNYTIEYKAVADTTPPLLSNVEFYALNSSKHLIGVDEIAFNFSNLEDIEYMRINFTVNDSTGIFDDIVFYYTANGTDACALGNNQSDTCYNLTNYNWIEYRNGTDTMTFRDTGGASAGDYINCSYTGILTERNYTCEIDEHYNPNVEKHYPLNFSNNTWQDGINQRIKKNTIWRINLTDIGIPLDAQEYKLDFRVNYTDNVPIHPLFAFICNTTYVTGNPETSPNCHLVAGKLPEDLQDDGTKFRGIFTQSLVNDLGDIGYVVLLSDSPASRYYIMRNHQFLGTTPIRTAISNDKGDSYTTLADGTETELNINWFHNDTQFVFKVFANDTLNNFANSTNQTMTWNYGALNEPPIVDIIVPEINSNHSTPINITWIVAEPDGDNYITNITANNGTDTIVINGSLDKGITYTEWDISEVSNGLWNLTINATENETTPALSGSEMHEIRIDTIPPNFIIANLSVLTNETTIPLLNFNATDDGVGVDGFAINWTTTFAIDYNDGNLTNSSAIIEGEYWINASVNDTLGNVNYSIILINVTNATPSDTINPFINITFPAINNTNTTDTGYDVNYTASDDIDLSVCWWVVNGGSNNYLADCTINITGQTWIEGLNLVEVYANDTANNINSSNITFRLDTTPPSFDHTLVTQTVPENQDLEYDINATDVGVGVDGYSINDSYEGLFAINFITGNLTNNTDFSEISGEFYINVTVNDTLNNKNTSIIFINITAIDSIPPEFLIVYPPNNTNSSNTGLHVNYTTTDNVELDLCWYSNDSMVVNSTPTACTVNITTVTWSEGIHNVTIFGNDTSGNENQSLPIFFTIDTINPFINITFPAINNTNTTDTGYDVNYTTSDIALDTCWWEVNGGGVTMLADCTTNLTGETWTEGLNKVDIYVNDTSNNINSSNITFRLDTTPPDFEIANLSVLTNETTIPLLNFNATDDGVGVGYFAINWTDTFTINETDGNLTNSSAIIEGEYWINASVNDTLGNTNYTIILINVTNATVLVDTTPPTFDNPRNITHTANTSLSESFSASDTSGISYYLLNDTTIFNISQEGLVTNVTNVSSVEIYYLNLTVNDTVNNQNSLEFWINVTDGEVDTPRYIQKWKNRITGTIIAWIDNAGNFFIAGDLNVSQNIYVEGCVRYNITGTTDTIGDCI